MNRSTVTTFVAVTLALLGCGVSTARADQTLAEQMVEQLQTKVARLEERVHQLENERADLLATINSKEPPAQSLADVVKKRMPEKAIEAAPAVAVVEEVKAVETPAAPKEEADAVAISEVTVKEVAAAEVAEEEIAAVEQEDAVEVATSDVAADEEVVAEAEDAEFAAVEQDAIVEVATQQPMIEQQAVVDAEIATLQEQEVAVTDQEVAIAEEQINAAEPMIEQVAAVEAEATSVAADDAEEAITIASTEQAAEAPATPMHIESAGPSTQPSAVSTIEEATDEQADAEETIDPTVAQADGDAGAGL